MIYIIINREDINDAINGNLENKSIPCTETNIFDVASSIKSDEIILIWEDKALNPLPLWVVSDKVYLETLAYIDTYIKKYTPFTAFFRVISKSTFIKERGIKRNNSNFDTDVLIGVVIAEAHLQYDRSMERGKML